MMYDFFKTNLDSNDKCYNFLIKKRWNNLPKCTHCGCTKSSTKKRRYTCLGCGKSYSVIVGTMFESTKLPLDKWFQAIYEILAAKKGISSLQLSRLINVSENTAGRLQLKIRSAMDTNSAIISFISKHIKLKTDRTLNNVRIRKINNPTTIKKLGIRIEHKLWISLKRAISGQFHQISLQYAQLYIREIEFKHAHRHSKNRGFNILMNSALNMHLPLCKG